MRSAVVAKLVYVAATILSAVIIMCRILYETLHYFCFGTKIWTDDMFCDACLDICFASLL